MSKVAVTGNASGTGVFTVASPNSNTDRTLTLPDESGTVLTGVSSLVAGNLTGSVPTSAMPAGSVIQVVQYTTNGGGTFSNNDYVEMFSGAITPSSTSSKILIMYQLGVGPSDNQPFSARIKRDSTVVGSSTASGGTVRLSNMSAGMFSAYSENDRVHGIQGHFLDSPSTTSAITYRIDVSPRNDIGAISWRFGAPWNNVTSGFIHKVLNILTLMEIAG